MALEFGEAIFGTLEKSSEESTKIEIPQNLPTPQFNQQQFTSQEEQEKIFGVIPQGQVVPDVQNGIWINILPPPPQQQVVKSASLLEGNLFKETNDGRLISAKTGSIISNATISIDGITRHWINETENHHEDLYSVQVDIAGSNTKTLEVPKAKLKEVYKDIAKNPAAFVSSKSQDAIAEYTVQVHHRDVEDNPNLPVRNTSVVNGWLEADGDYHIGDDAFYKDQEKPAVDLNDRFEIFQKGFHVLDVGYWNDIIIFIFLFALIAYSLAIFRKGNVNLRNILWLVGNSNSFKTAVVELFANIFCKNRARALVRMSSTSSYLRNNVLKLRDGVVGIDDNSNTSGAKNSLMLENAETLDRAIGDGQFEGQMSQKEIGKVNVNLVRSAIIMTGEENLDFDFSSMTRILVLLIEEGTFDKAILRYFQEHPEFLREFDALYIEYLKERKSWVIAHCKSNFQKYREHYEDALSIPRLIDLASTMSIQADVFVDFAKWCGMSIEEAEAFRARAIQAVINSIRKHEVSSKQRGVVYRFLYALRQIINPSEIAESEEKYIIDESKYLGFRESVKSMIWLKFEDMYDAVKRFYAKQGESFTPKPQTIKMELLKKNVSVGKLSENGEAGAEYLCRAKKGSRKRMLVLKMDEVERILNENESEEN